MSELQAVRTGRRSWSRKQRAEPRRLQQLNQRAGSTIAVIPRNRWSAERSRITLPRTAGPRSSRSRRRDALRLSSSGSSTRSGSSWASILSASQQTSIMYFIVAPSRRVAVSMDDERGRPRSTFRVRTGIRPHIAIIGLGVRDFSRARRFYADGLGWPVLQEEGEWICFSLGDGSSALTLYPWDELAGGAGVSGRGKRLPWRHVLVQRSFGRARRPGPRGSRSCRCDGHEAAGANAVGRVQRLVRGSGRPRLGSRDGCHRAPILGVAGALSHDAGRGLITARRRRPRPENGSRGGVSARTIGA